MGNNSLPDILINERLIHPSIAVHLFEKDRKGEYLEKYSYELYYPIMASALIKVSATLIHTYIIDQLIENHKTLEESFESTQIKALLIKLWKLNQLNSLEDSIKLIEYLFNTQYRFLVDEAYSNVIKSWKEIFPKFDDNYRGPKSNICEEYDLEKLLFDLIETLKVLKTTTINEEQQSIKFKLDNTTKVIKLSPFFQFRIDKNLKSKFLVIPIKTEIDKDMFSYKVWYQNPFSTDENGLEEIYRFNHKDDKSLLTRKILKSVGVQLPNHVVQVSGSFEYLQKIIDTTVNVFAVIFGIDEKNTINKGANLYFKKFIKSMKYGSSTQNHEIHYDFTGDLRDISNYLWVIIIEIGIYNFVKRAIQYFEGDVYVENAYAVNNLSNQFESYKQRVEKELLDRKQEMKTSFPDDSSYYKERLSFINESVPITVFLKDLGLNTTNLFSDYSELTSIDDYINFINNDEGGNTISSSEKIWKFLYCFYTGVYAYCEYLEKKNENSRSFGDIDADADDVMINTAKLAYENLDKSKDTLYTRNLLANLTELLGKMNEKRYSYKYFGRDVMVNESGIKKIHEFINLRNALAHSSKNDKIRSKEEHKESIELLLSNLMFLKTGKLSEIHREISADSDMTFCVYPQVVSFRETIIKRNSVSITGYETYSSNIKNEDKNNNNKLILTSQKINQFKEYYCIPHALRSTDEFMIEPFLIACEDFDRLVPIHNAL